MITELLYNKLKPYEAYLASAQQGYIRCLTPKEVQELEAIYNQLGYKLTNRNCGECVLLMCKVLAGQFFTYKPLNIEANEQQDQTKKSSTKKGKG